MTRAHESFNVNMRTLKTTLKLKMEGTDVQSTVNVVVINFVFKKIILNKVAGNPLKWKQFQEM